MNGQLHRKILGPDENSSISPGAACSANALDAAMRNSRLPCAASVTSIAVCC